jgi:hypothetical protein
MNIENQYRSALELTHQMLGLAVAQEWEALCRLGEQRARIIEDAARANLAVPDAQQRNIAGMVATMEQESAEIMERVQRWQEDAKILLRVKN